jgi:hypothetical protein
MSRALVYAASNLLSPSRSLLLSLGGSSQLVEFRFHLRDLLFQISEIIFKLLYAVASSAWTSGKSGSEPLSVSVFPPVLVSVMLPWAPLMPPVTTTMTHIRTSYLRLFG